MMVERSHSRLLLVVSVYLLWMLWLTPFFPGYFSLLTLTHTVQLMFEQEQLGFFI